ncbi:hypothetical protein BDM02DRAFT_3124270, partial [Thelephora ganbajun]
VDTLPELHLADVGVNRGFWKSLYLWKASRGSWIFLVEKRGAREPTHHTDSPITLGGSTATDPTRSWLVAKRRTSCTNVNAGTRTD